MEDWNSNHHASVARLIDFHENDQQITTAVGNDALITTGATLYGAQSIITIKNFQAPQSYSFDVELEDGVSLSLDNDGTVDIMGNGQNLMGEIKKPWAVDAEGNAVETWFEVQGRTLIQHVDFNEDTAFPVVADPAWWQTTGTALMCSGELALIAVPGAKLLAAISKSERIIKSSRQLTRAYEKLGGRMEQVVDKIRKYYFSKEEIDAGTAKAVEELLQKGGSTLINALGIGSCYQLGVQFLGWPSLG